MTQPELEKLIDTKAKSQIDEAKESIKKELSGTISAENENKINEAVEKAVKKIQDDAAHDKSVQVKMLEQFEAAASASKSKGVIPETSKSVVDQMIASGLYAMNAKSATNISNVTTDEILAAAKKHYPESKALHAALTQKKELNASTPTDGGFTIPTAFSADYIKALYANTILDKLGLRRVPMPNGNFTIPKMSSSSAASWVGETTSSGETQPGFAAVNLKAKKLKALCAVSNTLLRQSGVGLESWVADDLQEKARIALDNAFLYGAGTEYTPKGLENQTDVQTSGSSTTAFSLTTPIDMVALLEQANVPMTNVSWLFSPTGKSWILSKAFSSGPWAWADEMLRNKTLNGYKYVTSSTVSYTSSGPYSDFWIGDFSQMIWGVGYDMTMEMSREGTYNDGSNIISAFDQDLTLVRLITEHDFGCRQGVAFVHGTYSKS